MKSLVDAIDTKALIVDSIAEAPSVVGLGFAADSGSNPFATMTVEDRLSELDSLWERRFSSTVTFIQRIPADPTRISPGVRRLPGGDAFAELFGPIGVVTFDLWARAKELYRRVSTFLVRLRHGLFGFRQMVLDGVDLRATISLAFDNDIKLSLDGRAFTDATVASLHRELAMLRQHLTDALSVFAKVVEIVAGVMMAASSPLAAVRSLWKALTSLYDLLVRRLG